MTFIHGNYFHELTSKTRETDTKVYLYNRMNNSRENPLQFSVTNPCVYYLPREGGKMKHYRP
jgi:hypothetical protein